MPRRLRRRLRVERLEDRVTPTGNILVSTVSGSAQVIKEITPSGSVVRTLTPPPFDDARDIIVAANGNINVFNGTFSPQVSSYSASTGIWTNRSTANWSTANNITYGGVASWGNYVFVTDMTTANEGSPNNGLIRFNVATGAIERFDIGHDLIQLTMGLDGRLYTLQYPTGVGSPVREYDPVSMQQVGYVNLNLPDPRGIAVAANGDIYAVQWDRSVIHMDAAGNVLGSVSLGGPGLGVINLSDINISTEGQLVVGSRNNIVTLMDADLSNITYVTVGNQFDDTLFVAWAHPQLPPTPPFLGGIESGPLTYHAGDTDVITESVTLSQQGANTITGGTVSINSGFTPGEDQLRFTPNFGITSVYNPDTGVLTLNGQASLAAYQAALQSVTYTDTNIDPVASTRTVSFQVLGGTPEHLPSNMVSRDITVTPHAGPTISNVETTPLEITEGDAATPITTSLTLTDPDSATLCSAYVYFSSGYVPGEDVIGFENTSSIDGDFDVETGVLTMYGKASVADYEAAIQSITYQNTSANPSAATRKIKIWVDDAFPVHHASNYVSRKVTVAAVNTPPSLIVPANGAKTPQDQEVAVVGLGAADPDDQGGTETLTLSVGHGTIRLLDLTGVTIEGGANDSPSITISGTIADLNGALAGVSYHPDTAFIGFETLVLLLSDNGNTGSGGAQSDGSSVSIAVGLHSPPALANIEPTALAFTEGDAATPVTGQLTVSAGDSPMLASATVAITAGFVSGEDVLAFTPQGGITGSFDTVAGVLTLSGSAGAADYQAVLRSVTYRDTSAAPSSGSRIITFRVDDGFANNHLSNAKSRTGKVTAVNTAPTLTVPSSISGVHDADLVIDGITTADVDHGLSSESLTLSVAHGRVRFLNLAGVTVTGGANNSASVTITGSIATLNMALASGNLIYRPAAFYRGPDTLNLTLNDNGHSGTGGAKSDSKAIAIAVTPAAPVLTGVESSALAFTEGNAAKPITASLLLSSLDSMTITSATVAITGGFAGAQDVLGFVKQNGITGTYDPATGILTLTGSANYVLYQTALRTVTYRNTSQDPSTAPRTITFRADNGQSSNSLSNAVSRAVTVAAVNNAPTLTVPSPGPKGSSNTELEINGLLVADVDSRGAAERLTLAVAHGTIRFANLAGLTVTTGANNSATMTMQGPLAALNAALSNGNLVYRSAFSFAGADTLKLALTDDGHTGAGGAKVATKSLGIGIAHVAPVLDGIEATSLAYTEGDPATSITAGLSMSSIDSLTLAGATVKISAGFKSGQDVLAFTKQNGISGSYNAGTGVLTLSGTSSLANYEAALVTVTYRNTSLNPSTSPRTISVQVRDGFASNQLSNIVTRSVTLTAVNTAPTLKLPALSPKGAHNTDVRLGGIILADVDADGSREDLTLTVDHGRIRFAKMTGLTIKAGANDSATVTVEGTLPQLLAALANGNLIYHSDAAFIGSDTLHLDFDDAGSTGIGGPLVVSKPLAIIVT